MSKFKVGDLALTLVYDSLGTLAYGDHELMPLRGDFQPEQQKAKEVEA
ncbi:TPA: hypothetical protein ACXJEI_001050 [Pseudomonas aeruginosa]